MQLFIPVFCPSRTRQNWRLRKRLFIPDLDDPVLAPFSGVDRILIELTISSAGIPPNAIKFARPIFVQSAMPFFAERDKVLDAIGGRWRCLTISANHLQLPSDLECGGQLFSCGHRIGPRLPLRRDRRSGVSLQRTTPNDDGCCEQGCSSDGNRFHSYFPLHLQVTHQISFGYEPPGAGGLLPI
jgi:hypothetical protein